MYFIIAMLCVLQYSSSITTDMVSGGMTKKQETAISPARAYLPSMPGWPNTIQS